MQTLDWAVLIGTLIFIVFYGICKNKNPKNINEYLKAGNQSRWWTVGLSVMATQASAITFLSTPGQAFNDGMSFIQFYFGLPFATARYFDKSGTEKDYAKYVRTVSIK